MAKIQSPLEAAIHAELFRTILRLNVLVFVLTVGEPDIIDGIVRWLMANG